MPPCPAPARWWWMQVSGLLLQWQLQLGICSVGFFFFFFFFLLVMLLSEIPKLPTDPPVRGFPTLETSYSLLPPQDGSPPLSLLSLFSSFIFCPTSFWREWPAFLGAWCPLPMFRSCFLEVAHHSNDLLMNSWGRNWSPCPIPLPSWDRTP